MKNEIEEKINELKIKIHKLAFELYDKVEDLEALIGTRKITDWETEIEKTLDDLRAVLDGDDTIYGVKETTVYSLHAMQSIENSIKRIKKYMQKVAKEKNNE